MKLPSKEVVKQIKELSALVQRAILAVGVWILFCYCLSEQIMPDGLSLGDAMLLILVALGFGVVMFIGVAYGIFAALAPMKLSLVIINRLKKVGGKREVSPFLQDGTMTVVSIICLILFVLLPLSGGAKVTASDMKIAATFGCFFLMGFLLLAFFGVRGGDQPPRERKWTVALGLLAVLCPILTLHPALMNITMTTLGVRSSPGSLVLFSDEDHEKIDEIAKASGLNIRFCQLEKSSKWVTTDVRLIWHRIGTTSYITLMDHASNGHRSLTMPIAKESVSVIHPDHISLSCDKTLVGTATVP